MTIRARSAWSGDLGDHDMSPSVVRSKKSPTGQHWQCSRCYAENTGSHKWWRDQKNDTDENQLWYCVKCQLALYEWVTFTGGGKPLMDYLLEEQAAKTGLAKQGEPGGSTCSTHTLPVGTNPSSHVPTTQTTDMDVDRSVAWVRKWVFSSMFIMQPPDLPFSRQQVFALWGVWSWSFFFRFGFERKSPGASMCTSIYSLRGMCPIIYVEGLETMFYLHGS